MLLSSRPASFPIPFGANAGGSFIRAIPVNSQIGVQDGAASLNDGFVPLNSIPIAAGGIPPFQQDVNGILNQATAWCQWQEAGGIIRYDAAFATSGNGGYPAGAIVSSALVFGNRWLSTVDNNTADPDSLTQTTWFQDPGSISTGTLVPSLSSTVPPGYVAANASTIGAVGSGATSAVGITVQLLYRFIWFNFSNSICPVLTSGGVPTTRGANPDADFAALKRLTLPDMRGIGLRGVDTMGGGATTRLAGVPVSIGNTTTPGSGVGENLHLLLLTEIPSGITSSTGSAVTVHSASANQTIPVSSNSVSPQPSPSSGGNFVPAESGSASWAGVSSLTTGSAVGSTSTNTGNGTHNNTALDRLVFWNLKL